MSIQLFSLDFNSNDEHCHFLIELAEHGAGTALSKAMYIGSMSRLVDYDNIHQSNRLSAMCAQMLFECTRMIKTTSAFVMSRDLRPFAKTRMPRVFDAHRGECALTKSIASLLHDTDHTATFILHTYGRDAKAAVKAIKDMGHTVDDRHSFLPTQHMSFHGYDLVILDVVWRLDHSLGDPRIASGTSRGRITLMSLIRKALLNSATVLLTAEAGFRVSVLTRYARKISAVLLEGRLIIVCQQSTDSNDY